MKNPDSVSRGPARWERAALAALRRPNSQAAALYRERVSLARVVVDALEEAGESTKSRQPWEHVHKTYIVDDDGSSSKRVYSTCSMHCTIMQAALDMNTMDLDRILAAFNDSLQWLVIRPLDRTTLARDVRCYVCGTTVKRKVPK